MQSNVSTLRVCGECGAALARRATSCELCKASALSAREVRVNDAIGTFVRIAAAFRCRSCGARSPLEGLDVDGTVRCVSCGMVQALDLDVWSKAFDFAHGLADLGLRGPRQAPSPFADALETRAAYPFATSGIRTVDGVVRTASIELVAAIGHPPCARCKSPLELAAQGGVLQSRCGGCGDTASYRVPDGAAVVHPKPSAIVAPEARIDGAQARVEGDAGAIAIRCPSCSASLAVQGHDAVVTCSYCRTVCRIPSRALHALAPVGAEPIAFFAAFRGPSEMRARFDADAREAYAQLEAERSLEPMPIVKAPPAVLAMRAVTTTIVLALVGLALAPQFLALFAGR